MGKQFIRTLSQLIKGVRDRKWNSENVIVFPAVILYKSAGITAAKDIRATIEACMKLWQERQYSALLGDMEVEASLRAGRTREMTEDETDRDYNMKVLNGHLRAACRWLTDREGGGAKSPDDFCSKSGERVLTVLQLKHPEM